MSSFAPIYSYFVLCIVPQVQPSYWPSQQQFILKSTPKQLLVVNSSWIVGCLWSRNYSLPYISIVVVEIIVIKLRLAQRFDPVTEPVRVR
jgi:hypothetical protein